MSIFSFLFSKISAAKSRPRRRLRRSHYAEALESRQLLAAGLGIANDLAVLSDEFNDSASIAAWERVNEVENWNADQLQQWDVDQIQPGRMTMIPHTVVWYRSWRGPMVFKDVSGDFVFTTQVHITDRDEIDGSDTDDVPGDGQFSLGGVMIRTPRDIADPQADWTAGSMADDGTNNGENYVFLSLGYGAGGNEFSLEVKTTRNSNSQLELTPLGQDANVINVQTARIGTDVFTLYQRPGEEWQVHRRYSRPDMPDTLQVGLVTYTDWDKANDYDPFVHNSSVLTENGFDPTPGQPFNPDLVAGFEYARFVRPDVPDALNGIDLRTQASDAQLLTFLGEAANLTANEPVVDPPVGNENVPVMRIGMNLANVTDWSHAWVFRDAFKMTRPWSSRLLNTTTYEQPYGGDLAMDDRGWVTQLETTVNEAGETIQQRAQTYLFSEGGNPAGIYRAEWSGEGDISFGAATLEAGITADGRSFALLDLAEDQSLIITISEVNSDNYLRDIQIFMPDYNGQSLEMDNWQPGDEESPFHPLFVERLQPFDTIRFMQWQEVNQETRDLVTPQGVRPFDFATQATIGGQAGMAGVSVEYMVQLVNELDADPWFNMPHSANDDYVRDYAQFVRDNLDEDAEVYVEWSNEVWNYAFGFEANGWVQEQLELPENDGLTFLDIWAREARRDFAIWTEVFAGQEDRLVRVAAGTQSNVWLTNQLLVRMNGEFDAVSSTSYSGLDGALFDWVDDTTTEVEIIDRVLELSVPWSLATQAAHVELAEQYSQQLGREIDFVTYEGGSHLSAFGTPYADLVQSALDGPGMRDVYEALLNGMEQLGVNLHTQYVFSGQGVPSPWGEFAVLREMDLPLEEALEYRALLDFMNGDLAAPTVTVSIEATDNLAGELGDMAEFTVTRSGGVTYDDEFTVSYTIGGTATNGVDYQELSGTVVIPAGETTATIRITPLLDSLISSDEGSETITLTLTDGDEYDISADASSSATATLLDNLFVTVGDQSMSLFQSPLVIELPTIDSNGAALAYSVEVVDGEAYQLDQELGLFSNGSYYLNWGGQQERWMQGDAGWYFILPSGDFGYWQGSFGNSQVLATFDSSFYDDPAQLHNAQPTAAKTIVDNVLAISPSSGFVGQFDLDLTTSNATVSSTERFTVTVSNEVPVLAPIDNQTMVHSQDTLVLELSASDTDGDVLTFSASVVQTQAFLLDQEYSFTTDGDFYDNWGGQFERWIRGGDGDWFYLLPNGALHQWQGDFDSSPLIATLDPETYDDPTQLTSAQAIAATVNIEGNTATIDTQPGFAGSFAVEVTVSDGAAFTSESFVVTVTNETPLLSPIDDQVMSASQSSLNVSLDLSDADADDLTLTVELIDEAYELDQSLGLTTDGNFYENWGNHNEKWLLDAADEWYYILSNGEIYRWQGSFGSSELVASLDILYYDDPALLANAQPIAVTAHFVDDVLVIERNSQASGQFQVRVTASDGNVSTSRVFTVTLED